MPVTLTLPYPPSVNKYWRHVMRGRRNITLLSAEGRAYQAEALFYIRSQLGFSFRPLVGHLALRARIHPPDYIRRDLDNCLKAMLDAMTHAKVWVDDCQVHELHLAWGEVRKGGMALVEISEMAAADVKFARPEKTGGNKRKKQ